MTLFSSERLWGFHIFKLFSTFWRFGNVFYFLIIIIAISSHVIQILVWRNFRFVILVFVGEIKFNKKFSFFFTFNNVSFCILLSSKYIPSFRKLFDFFQINLTSKRLVNFAYIIFVEKGNIEPNLIFFAVLKFFKIFLLICLLFLRERRGDNFVESG